MGKVISAIIETFTHSCTALNSYNLALQQVSDSVIAGRAGG
ncbi:hypothetical protein OTSANNIE_0547 [Anaplasma phagocytophilum str. Annie]|nr:hypothetical protein APHWEB_0168 [Anaplasma phagocytophilum str. Webster]KJV87946.1 hypothetical protein APHNYW_0302 [Anaplasma phagocytophilum str. ApNYW]KJV99309.1 hypothetical protein OTSANNIE_0547 [Anaplasma phagocytophilum str. Annie]